MCGRTSGSSWDARPTACPCRGERQAPPLGGASLTGGSVRRALHLLTNLKVLVEEPSKTEQEEEEVEKDEDEGRYSSLSTDEQKSC